MEGVMMRGECSQCIAVRDEDGVIRKETSRKKPAKKRNWFFRLFIIRGIYNFFLSMLDGVNVLMRSASVYGEDEPSKFEKKVAEKLHINIMSVVSFFSVAIALLFAVGLFILAPQYATIGIKKLANLKGDTFGWELSFNLIEGLIRIIIFVLYIVLVSFLKDIKRTFMYHGAEHKTISCYENGLDLTIENVKKCSRVHDRCGTTFLFYVMFISIIVFSIANSLIKLDNAIYRALLKIALLPLVAGLSYEVLKLLAKTKNKFWLIFKFPGLLLQKLTTKEPTEDMIEVAIESFNTVLLMDKDQSIPVVKFETYKLVTEVLKEVKILFTANNVDLSDAEWLVSVISGIPRSELSKTDKKIKPSLIEKIKLLAQKRIMGEPLQYVLGTTDFYGIELKTDKRALIPRPETEELVEMALKHINNQSVVLDLCTGTGAIALKIKKEKDCVVYASDVSFDALSLAQENAKNLGLDINFVNSDMFNNIKHKFDIIISNPPYIPTKDIIDLDKEVKFEPVLALDGGIDGLDFYKIIAENAQNYLNNNGKIFLEFGIGQSEDIKKIFINYSSVEIIKDIFGKERIAVVTK